MSDADIHIKGGTIVDGTRVPRYQGDVWIKDGKIAQIGGRADGVADRVIDADGLIVAPGFVDLHTHYDAQIRWDPWCTISGWHGVTSVVLGNCGFGFAPVQARLPRALDAHDDPHRGHPVRVDGRGHAARTGTGRRSPSTSTRSTRAPLGRQRHPVHADGVADDLRDGPRGGQDPPGHRRRSARRCSACCTRAWTPACAASPSSASGRNSTQADFDGTPMVTDTMCDEDILAWPRCSPSATRASSRSPRPPATSSADLAFVEKLAAVAERPILHNAVAPTRKRSRRPPQVAATGSSSCRDQGLQIYGQCATVRAGFAFTLEHWNLYDSSPGVARASPPARTDEKIAKMARPGAARGARRRGRGGRQGALLASRPASAARPQDLVVQGVNRPAPTCSSTSGAVARRHRRRRRASTPIEVMLDLSLAGRPERRVPRPGPGLERRLHGRDDQRRPTRIPGVSDGGAHTKFFTGGAWTHRLADAGWCATRASSRWRRPTTGCRRWPPTPPASATVASLREGAAADVRRLRHGRARHRARAGSARSSTTCPAASGAGCSGPRATSRSSSTARSRSSDGECTGATPGRLLRHGRG